MSNAIAARGHGRTEAVASSGSNQFAMLAPVVEVGHGQHLTGLANPGSKGAVAKKRTEEPSVRVRAFALPADAAMLVEHQPVACAELCDLPPLSVLGVPT